MKIRTRIIESNSYTHRRTPPLAITRPWAALEVLKASQAAKDEIGGVTGGWPDRNLANSPPSRNSKTVPSVLPPEFWSSLSVSRLDYCACQPATVTPRRAHSMVRSPSKNGFRNLPESRRTFLGFQTPPLLPRHETCTLVTIVLPLATRSTSGNTLTTEAAVHSVVGSTVAIPVPRLG